MQNLSDEASALEDDNDSIADSNYEPMMMNHLIVPIQTLLPPSCLRKSQTPIMMSYPLLLVQFSITRK
ncbi:unnamed protein product [Acanthoscelides obtectus]|uniref:Uncharacterized protein n=1 Tax=Acanthoscelides obtectus TaxID=200917 RepID=A0A9P0L816_ACAOB|nr:unnamed protein product [Acanthoscelides obtectus]CAK1635887.1 hypothetical protein AOBTE_LOCUS9594 [Acanthoscelides obtectus]